MDSEEAAQKATERAAKAAAR